MTMTKTITSAFEKLNKKINDIFSQTEQNIKDANKRLGELTEAMAERGTGSLETVQANAKDQLEHDQVKTFLDGQLDKLKQLKETHSKEIYDEIYQLKQNVLEKAKSDKKAKADKQAMEHLNAINELDSKLEKSLDELSFAFDSEVSNFNPYMLENENRNAQYYLTGYSSVGYRSIKQRIIDGQLK